MDENDMNMPPDGDDYEDKMILGVDEEEGDQDDGLDRIDDMIPGVEDLPLFASLEARKTDADIKRKEEEIEKLVEKVTDMAQRLKVMKEHFKNVQQELDHTNVLFNSKNAEIQTEKHLRQLTSRALGRSQGEKKALVMEIEKIQDELSVVQTNIHDANEKMDEFKMQMNWNQEELERWVVAARQKEEDNMALQKYTRADETKIKDITLQIEQLTKNKLHQQELLANEATDTVAKQVELDRIAEEFRKLHSERQAMVRLWQDTIEEIKKRDSEINALGERFALAKIERVKKEEKVASQIKKLLDQQGENRDVESRAEMLQRVVSRKREEMMTGNMKLIEFRDELESLKNELTTAAEGLVVKRNHNVHKSQNNEEKRVKLERERQKYKVVKANLENAKDSTVKAEEIARIAEVEMQRKEQDYEAEQTRIKVLKDKHFKEMQAVHELKMEETKLRNDISGAKSIGKNLDFQLNRLDKEASRQQELLYNAEFQIQQIERKVARGMGERSDEEKRQLRAQIAECEKNLEQGREKRKMLQAQSRKLHNELVAIKAQRDDAVVQKTRLADIQTELELSNRMTDEEIKRETKVKEENTVQNDLMKLEVRRLRDLLSAKADAVFSLENRREQLRLSMQERIQEIAVHRDVLKAEMRTLNDEKHRVTMDLRGKELVVEKLKARFEALSTVQTDDKPQSYYIILAAQRREELVRKGDELDQGVRKCEREIRALQATLDHLTARNIAYRNSFQKVDLKSDDAEILKQLEDRTKAGKDSLFRKKKELQRLMTDFEEDNRRRDQLRQQIAKIDKQREHLTGARSQVTDEILSQQAQMDELMEKIDRLTLNHRTKVAESMGLDATAFEGGTLEEKSAQTEVLKDVVQNVLFTLGQLASEFPEVSDVLAQRLEEANLQMPPRPPSRINNTSRTGSAKGVRTAGTTYSGRPGTGGSDVISSKSGSQTSGVRLPPIPGAQGPGPGPGQAVRQRTFNMGDL